jgi:hypothetical protein
VQVVSVQCNDETPLFGEFIVATERVRWRDHEGEWREDSPTNFCAAAGMKSPKDWPKNIRVCPVDYPSQCCKTAAMLCAF